MSTGTLRQVRNWGQHNKGMDAIMGSPTMAATERQKNFIRSLLDELKDLDAETHRTAFGWVAAHRDMTAATASDVITRLKARVAVAREPRVEAPAREYTPRDNFTDVPDGYYALTADEGHTAFFRIGTWKNSPNRKVAVQASDTLHHMSRASGTAVLKKIREAGVDSAAKRYANELGRCYRCGRTLTDEESRALGIGPTCRGK